MTNNICKSGFSDLKSNSTPEISVLVSTYNTPIYMLKEAIASILSQSFKNFELLIVDDASTNGICEYLDTLTDSRIRIFKNTQRIGISKSKNLGINQASGKYLALMDSDDVAKPDRLKTQYRYMEKHKDVLLCGSWFQFFGNKSGISRVKINNMESYRIRMFSTYPGPLQSTFFIRLVSLKRNNIQYDETLSYAEDYKLLLDISEHSRIAVVRRPLVMHRVHEGQVTSTKIEAIAESEKKVKSYLLSTLIDNLSGDEIELHSKCTCGYYRDVPMTQETELFYQKLIDINRIKKVYHTRQFESMIYQIKKRLIWQTIKRGFSKSEKIIIFFKKLPFFIATKEIVKMSKMKISHLIVSKIFKNSRHV